VLENFLPTNFYNDRALPLQPPGILIGNVDAFTRRNPMSQVDGRLSDLLLRRGAIEQKIAIEKRRIRDHSRLRGAIRARALGEALLRLHGEGRLAEIVVSDLKADLRAQHKPGSAVWESLQDSAFDLGGRLHDPAEPDASGSQPG
jgi:hypothetical protein